MIPQGLCQRRMRAEGRCVTCCQPHNSGMARCRGCQDTANANHRARRRELIRNGRCQACGEWLPPSDYTRCIACRVKTAARDQRRRARAKGAA